MKIKWEYNLVPQPTNMTAPQIEMFLDKYGYDGWELCCHNYGCFIFKKPIEE